MVLGSSVGREGAFGGRGWRYGGGGVVAAGEGSRLGDDGAGVMELLVQRSVGHDVRFCREGEIGDD